VNRAAIDDGSARRPAAIDPSTTQVRSGPPSKGERERAVMDDRAQILRLFNAMDQRIARSTEQRRILSDGIEHGPQVRRRRCDNPQHVGRRRLPLQCLTDLMIAPLQLLEESGVLDGDDRLIREHLHEGDLLLSEWTDLVASHGDRTDANPVTQEWHPHRRAVS
jgi:hypothetical protein